MKGHQYTSGRALCVLALAATFFIQSCSSSSSDGPGVSDDAPFVAPVDAQTLAAALITGSSSTDTAQFWECAVSDGSRFAYRLFADGRGSEADMINSGPASGFGWQTSSATTMDIFDIDGNMIGTFTDITFSDRNNVSLMASTTSSLVCQRKGAPPVDTPSANNTLSYGGVVYDLTHAIEEPFRFRPSTGDTHSSSEFSIADARFFALEVLNPLGPGPLIVQRPRFATAWLRAQLYSPGGNGVNSGTFTYEPESTDEDGASVAGRSFFKDGKFGVDIDGDGSIQADANEFLEVTAGSITLTRTNGNNARMDFSLTLENGVSLNGSFTGLYVPH